MMANDPSELRGIEECLNHLRKVLLCLDGPLREKMPEPYTVDRAAAYLQTVIDLFEQIEPPEA
jgi:hypothetical protein